VDGSANVAMACS